MAKPLFPPPQILPVLWFIFDGREGEARGSHVPGRCPATQQHPQFLPVPVIGLFLCNLNRSGMFPGASASPNVRGWAGLTQSHNYGIQKLA